MSTPKVVLLFSGQGAQKVGMGQDLAAAYPAAKALLDQADAALPFSLSEVMFAGPMEELTQTSRCQPALFAHGLAIWAVLQERLPSLVLAGCAGLSLGEFTAHCAAGTFDFATGLNLVFQRGSFMEEACAKTSGSMAAMIGGTEEAVRELAAECGVDVANLNAPGQIVLSGSADGIEKAVAGAKAKGVTKAIPLTVAGAYHSKLMQSAQDQLAEVLAKTELQTPGVPVYCNYEAKAVSHADEIRSTLTSQVTGSVRWTECMQQVLAQGPTVFIECGPDATLAGLMRRIDKSAKVLSISDAASLDKAVEELSALLLTA
jgi:[acyl-carrier-protein] S-malonyltransferase